MRRRVPTAGAGAAWLLCSLPAQAHLATTGLGPVYDGVSHLLLSFTDLLPALAMALLAGLNGKTAARWAAFVLPAAWLTGGLIGFHAGLPSLPPITLSFSLLLLGGLVATDLRLRPLAVCSVAMALGLLHGTMNGADIALAGREATALAGIAGAIFVTATVLAAAVASLQFPWARIVVRVAGSWIAAIGLLLLGWSISGRG
jgi:urease accessory protein